MGTLPFDTLKFATRLQSGGFTQDQARATAEAFAEATGEELATKADLQSEMSGLRADLHSEVSGLRTELRSEVSGLRAELRSEVSGLRAELKSEVSGLRAELKSEVSDLRAGMRELELRMTIKLGGLIVGATGLILAAMRYLPPGHP